MPVSALSPRADRRSAGPGRGSARRSASHELGQDDRWRAALDLRKRAMPNATSFRLVNAESDFLSGLVVDKYEDLLVVQTSSLGMDLRLPTIVAEPSTTPQKASCASVSLPHPARILSMPHSWSSGALRSQKGSPSS